MKKIQCEMCGSGELEKKENMYVCSSCGTKYTVEEAKKLMVTIDNSDKIKQLYTAARQAKGSNDAENAAKYYDLIKQDNPNDWEAYFYNVYFRVAQTKIMYIESAATQIQNCLSTTFTLIAESSDSEQVKKANTTEVANRVSQICAVLHESAKEHYTSTIQRGFEYQSLSNSGNYMGEYVLRANAVCNSLFACGNMIEYLYEKDETMMKLACRLWKEGVYIWKNIYAAYDDHTARYNNIKNTIVAKIKKVEPSYLFTSPSYYGHPQFIVDILKKASNSDFGIASSGASSGGSSGGCYVATAVYGSYDCPPVWTLRRYRDNTLATTWYGRAFIRTYYAISPTLVKWFGNTEWFKRMWKGKLDHMVSKLQANGVDSTPYQDRDWQI